MYIVTIWYYIRIFNAIILDHNFLIFSVFWMMLVWIIVFKG